MNQHLNKTTKSLKKPFHMAAAGLTSDFRGLRGRCPLRFFLNKRNNQRYLFRGWPRCNRIRSAPQMGRMMMAVSVAKGPLTHAQKARGFPHRSTTLHQPRVCGVSQGILKNYVSSSLDVDLYLAIERINCWACSSDFRAANRALI